MKMTEFLADTGISDLDSVFASHSFPLWMNEAAPRSMNSIDSILEDKVLKMTHLDLQKKKNVSRDTMCVPNTWRPFSAARHSKRTA